MSEPETASAEEAPAAPIEFLAHDRFHAMTHVAAALPRVSDTIKTRLAKALHSMTHRGPVHVVIPAPLGAHGHAAQEEEDPLLPADGAYAIKGHNFVKV